MVSVPNDTTINVTVPAGAAETTVDVVVTNDNGAATLSNAYSYHPTPTVSSIVPNAGSSLGGMVSLEIAALLSVVLAQDIAGDREQERAEAGVAPETRACLDAPEEGLLDQVLDGVPEQGQAKADPVELHVDSAFQADQPFRRQGGIVDKIHSAADARRMVKFT